VSPRVVLLAAALAAALATPAVRAAAACPARSAEATLSAPLVHVTSKIRGGGDLTIVALGSSSTAGAGASSLETSYPSRLAAELRERLPGRRIQVINRGVGGETDVQMMRRFDIDVLPHKPDLVIWQLGTNALLMEDGVTRDAPRIKAGIARLKAASADVILMDPQYAPKVLRDPDHGEMVHLLEAVAAEERIALFARFAVMREWVRSGAADFTTILSADQLHMNDVSYGCMARLLADSILAATTGGQPMVAATPGR
jgi:lysophospholipase L1-like esterase